jgi:hypothetical protein
MIIPDSLSSAASGHRVILQYARKVIAVFLIKLHGMQEQGSMREAF